MRGQQNVPSLRGEGKRLQARRRASPRALHPVDEPSGLGRVAAHSGARLHALLSGMRLRGWTQAARSWMRSRFDPARGTSTSVRGNPARYSPGARLRWRAAARVAARCRSRPMRPSKTHGAPRALEPQPSATHDDEGPPREEPKDWKTGVTFSHGWPLSLRCLGWPDALPRAERLLRSSGRPLPRDVVRLGTRLQSTGVGGAP